MPNESNFDFPIVQLEADSPQAVGKPGLYDFTMPVGNTGIVFIAALQGILRENGVDFTLLAQQAAYRRAASTLAQWGVISSDTFAFLAQGANLSASDLAFRYSVSVPTAQGWLDGQIPVPTAVWRCLAAFVCYLDGRSLADCAPPPTSLRPRLIRVFPNVPTPSMVPSSSPLCPPPPPVC